MQHMTPGQVLPHSRTSRAHSTRTTAVFWCLAASFRPCCGAVGKDAWPSAERDGRLYRVQPITASAHRSMKSRVALTVARGHVRGKAEAGPGRARDQVGCERASRAERREFTSRAAWPQGHEANALEHLDWPEKWANAATGALAPTAAHAARGWGWRLCNSSCRPCWPELRHQRAQARAGRNPIADERQQKPGGSSSVPRCARSAAASEAVNGRSLPAEANASSCLTAVPGATGESKAPAGGRRWISADIMSSGRVVLTPT